MKKIVLFLICIILCTQLYSITTPNWQLVSGGDPIAAPVITEYGLTVLLDGRTMAAITSKGNFQWLSTVPLGKPSAFLGKGNAGFIFTVSGKNKLSVFNPSGLCLWTKEAPAEIISAPIQGQDGRIFVQCNQMVACFGLNGTLKWSVNTEISSGFPLLQLEDGSILHIQEKTIEGRSTAIRISPFGEVLEELVFTGKISQAKEIDCGVLLLFTDGSFGCCSTSELKAITKWTIPSSVLSLNEASRLVTEKNSSFACILIPEGTNTKIAFADINNGKILSIQNVPVNTASLTFTDLDNDSVILCDTQTALSCSKNEGISWKTQIPSDKQWSYVAYTDNGYLIVFEKNSWVISAYRVTQKIGLRSTTKNSKFPKNMYKEFTDKSAKKYGITKESSSIFGRIISPSMLEEIEHNLSQGKFKEKEELWLAALNLECNQIQARFMTRSNELTAGNTPITDNLTYYQYILFIAGQMETSFFNRNLAAIIANEDDEALLQTALQSAANTGYDPDNILLDNIQRLTYKKQIHNPRIAQNLCNAVYEICRYMGKPAIFTKGKEILSYLLNSSSDPGIKATASHTMEKIIALQM